MIRCLLLALLWTSAAFGQDAKAVLTDRFAGPVPERVPANTVLVLSAKQSVMGMGPKAAKFLADGGQQIEGLFDADGSPLYVLAVGEPKTITVQLIVAKGDTVDSKSVTIVVDGTGPRPPPDPPGPDPKPPEPVSGLASECLQKYGEAVADAFDKAAKQFIQHTPSLQIITDMGNALEPARVNSFMPLMERLNELRPSPTATADQKNAADLARSKELRLWVDQLRGRK